MVLADQLDRAFPDIGRINDPRLRELVRAQWRYVGERDPDHWHSDLETIPLHPSLPFETHGGLCSHIRGQMDIAQVLVPLYRREWKIDLDLDHFLACALVHDSAKVIEFVQVDGKLVATPGFDHALEGARIARTLGLPDAVVHMTAVHAYLGPKRLPRTAAAQLFQFLDPICIPVFPDHGRSAVERHLEANGWVAPAPPADLP